MEQPELPETAAPFASNAETILGRSQCSLVCLMAAAQCAWKGMEVCRASDLGAGKIRQELYLSISASSSYRSSKYVSTGTILTNRERRDENSLSGRQERWLVSWKPSVEEQPARLLEKQQDLSLTPAHGACFHSKGVPAWGGIFFSLGNKGVSPHHMKRCWMQLTKKTRYQPDRQGHWKGMLMYPVRRTNSELSETCSCCNTQYKKTHLVIYSYIYAHIHERKRGMCVCVCVCGGVLIPVSYSKSTNKKKA